MATDTVLITIMHRIAKTSSNLIPPGDDVSQYSEAEIKMRVYGSKLVLVVEQMQLITIWLVKACLLIMYNRMTLVLPQHKIVVATSIYVAIAFVVMEVLYLGVWCRPFNQYWAVPPNSKQCSAATNHLITNAVFNISSDLIILSIPMPLLFKVRLPKKNKTILFVIFCIGAFTIVAAVLNKYYSFTNPFGTEWTICPMFFHVDPADRDALLGYTYEKEREKDIQALPGVAGKEVSKHKKKKNLKSQGRFLGRTPDVDERDRKDYFVPRTDLFDAHCEEVINRYRLGKDLLRQESVVDIKYDKISRFNETELGSMISDVTMADEREVFRVETDQGVRFAHLVVLAVGPGNAPLIPLVPGLPSQRPHEGFAHAMQIKQFPPSHVMNRIKAGQLTKRFDMIMQARNGGSMTPRYRKILDSYVARRKIELHNYTKLHCVSWEQSSKTWACEVSSAESTFKLPPVDYMVFATGIQSDIRTIPYLQSIQRQYPIKSIGGLPCLNEDLMWDDNVPLFITGRLAGLQLGPGAPNLVGARVGAERIAWNVDEALKKLGKLSINAQDESDDDSSDEKMVAYAAARDNRFDSLFELDDDAA
ncbi:hypothetical protein ACET3X_006668 [Alternaria dauci]|uniref:Rhodopsin domain-containing protein n=1 Tax=Alternaria dauci TaxID=48095 RepID=A0ABR3UF65_9PLEO